MKSSKLDEARFLAVLQRILPKTISDPHLANSIYEQVLNEVRLFKSLDSFEKFCEKGSLPDAEPATVEEFKSQLVGNFGEENVVVTPKEDGKAVAVEIALPDHIVNTEVKVVAPGSEEEEAAGAPFVPFPVCLPDDPALVWSLARRENLGPDEAVRALANIQEEFWATKKGQMLQRDGVEKSFAEFLTNIPAAALSESGIKRYHKDPETLKTMHLIPTVEVGVAL
ncbi:MAG: hypothetical protein WCH57_06960 [Verrucomicrobiota bacterium]